MYVVGLILLFSFTEPLSVHRLEYEKYKDYQVQVPETYHYPISLQNKTKSLNATVYGFLPYWRLGHENAIKWQDLSHIACFGVELSSTGGVANSHGWPSSWSTVVDSAHASGVKVHVVAIVFNHDDISSIIRNYRANAINTLISQVQAGNADGVNIDFETPYSSDSAYFALFLEELADSMHAHGYEVTVCFTAVNWYGRYETQRIANAVDGIFIMGYDYYYSGSSTSGPVSPLTGGTYNVTNSVNSYIAESGNQSGKFILGVPYYGYKWPTVDSTPYSPTRGTGSAEIYNVAIVNAENYGLLWDSQSQTPWYRHYVSGDGWYQCWFDDDSSLGLKYDLAIQKSLQGVGMWALTYDEGRYELWYALESHFSQGVPPPKPIGFYIIQPGPRRLQLFWSPVDTGTVSYEIWESEDGENFSYVTTTINTNYDTGLLEANSLHFYKVRAVNAFGKSEFTNVLGGVAWDTPIKILLVDGVDRESGTVNTHDFVVDHGKVIYDLGLPFISCSNECIEDSTVDLNNFETADWILGEEGTTTMAFSKPEQSMVKTYLENGGNLFVSGSEIGYDLIEKGDAGDSSFYHNYLKAEYQGDDAGSHTVVGVAGSIFEGFGPFEFDDGSWHYDVDYPDGVTAYGGSTVCMRYSGGTGWDAGIQYEGSFGSGDSISRVVYLGIPFESILPGARPGVMAAILQLFGYSVDVGEEVMFSKAEPVIVNNVVKNYIILNTPLEGIFELYDLLGRKVLTEDARIIKKIDVHHLPPGVYFYILRKRGKLERGRVVIVR